MEVVGGDLSGKTLAVLGLTYKPGTDTLRRSSAVELCVWLAKQRAQVRAYDPAITHLPLELQQSIVLCATASEAIREADAVIVATEWPVFRSLLVDDLIEEMRTPIVVDANRYLEKTVGSDSRVHYTTVGKTGKIR